MKHCACRYLGAEDVFEAWKLLNVYVTDPVNNGFLPYYKTDVVTGGYPCPKDKPSFEEACSPEAERTAACQDYCNLVKNGTLIDAVTKVGCTKIIIAQSSLIGNQNSRRQRLLY